MTAATTGAVAANAAVIAQATKAMGAIVYIEPDEFAFILEFNLESLVVHAQGGFLAVTHRYLTSYRGLIFFTKSKQPLRLPTHCHVVKAKKIWIPG